MVNTEFLITYYHDLFPALFFFVNLTIRRYGIWVINFWNWIFPFDVQLAVLQFIQKVEADLRGEVRLF